jgi:hypothetical protein
VPIVRVLSIAGLRRATALCVAALLAAGCYSFSEPSFDPGNKRDVLRSIVRRGIVVSQPIVGQTACDDPALVANSLFLTARMPDEQEPRDVYIHTYREKWWERSKEEVDACQGVYAKAHPGSDVVRLDIPTFRVFGADWSPELTRELRAAFEEASQAGLD